MLKKMSENHKLRSVYFLATPKQVDQLIEHGYSIIRNVKHKVYEARVTDQQQFIRIAEEFDVHTTMSEDAPKGNIEIETTIAGVDFKGVLDKLYNL